MGNSGLGMGLAQQCCGIKPVCNHIILCLLLYPIKKKFVTVKTSLILLNHKKTVDMCNKIFVNPPSHPNIEVCLDMKTYFSAPPGFGVVALHMNLTSLISPISY